MYKARQLIIVIPAETRRQGCLAPTSLYTVFSHPSMGRSLHAKAKSGIAYSSAHAQFRRRPSLLAGALLTEWLEVGNGGPRMLISDKLSKRKKEKGQVGVLPNSKRFHATCGTILGQLHWTTPAPDLHGQKQSQLRRPSFCEPGWALDTCWFPLNTL